MLRIDWHGQPLQLHADKAVLAESGRTLIITDPHFGKEASFKAAGIPLPWGSSALDLARLDKLLRETAALHLIILGDFFHDKHSLAPPIIEELSAWRNRHPALRCTLIRGNHDKHAGDPPDALRIACVGEPYQGEVFSFFHHPPGNPAKPSLAGHVHPSIKLQDKIGQWLRCPCFHFAPMTALLPAFGSFTGSFAIAPAAEDRVFAVGGDQVIEVRYGRRGAARTP